MKMKSLLSGCLAFFVSLLSACSKPAPPISDNVSSSQEGLSIESRASYTSAPTTAYAVTDASGQTVTDSEGKTITSLGTLPPATTLSTSATVFSHSSGKDSSRLPQDHTTASKHSSDKTTVRQPDSTTSSRSNTSKATESKATTTHTTTTTTTTRKPTSTTTTTTQKPTETEPQPSGPWYAPYDLTQIYAECKREIERLGMVWEEGLRPDSLGVSWANPDNTVVYTYYPEMFHLREYVMDELIPFYYNKPYSRQSCRIWLEPYAESPGDYWIYFLERR